LGVADRSRQVIVVDDDAGVRDSLAFLLETHGHDVTAYDSATAFLQDRPERPACLIVDMYMPAMSGLQLAARLRGEGDTVPILLVTGAASTAIASAAAQVGIARVLGKPASQDDLLAFVDANVAKHA
jgi:FixJ family two-component response regulator